MCHLTSISEMPASLWHAWPDDLLESTHPSQYSDVFWHHLHSVLAFSWHLPSIFEYKCSIRTYGFPSRKVSYIELYNEQHWTTMWGKALPPNHVYLLWIYPLFAVFCGACSMNIIAQRTLETSFVALRGTPFFRLASLSQVISLHEGHTTMQTLTYQRKSDLWGQERRVTRSSHAEAQTVNKLNWIELNIQIKFQKKCIWNNCAFMCVPRFSAYTCICVSGCSGCAWEDWHMRLPSLTTQHVPLQITARKSHVDTL